MHIWTRFEVLYLAMKRWTKPHCSVKQPKKTARQASEGLHIPMDTNEVEVEKLEKNAIDGPFLLRASLCCEYQPDVLSNVRQAIDDLAVQLLKSEISTLGGRLKIVFLITATGSDCCNESVILFAWPSIAFFTRSLNTLTNYFFLGKGNGFPAWIFMLLIRAYMMTMQRRHNFY